MSSNQIPVSSSQFKSILDGALTEYKKITGNDLLDNWLAKELQSCDSAEAILDIIQSHAEAFDKFRNGDNKLMKWVRSSVHVLYTISSTLGEGVGIALPPAKAVFVGIGVLLAVRSSDVQSSHDALVDLFERIQFFLKRLGVHTQISLTKDMVEILMKIVAEVLSILSIATKEMQQSRTKTYLKKLVGRTDIEDALKRLDSLTREEFQMAMVEVRMALAQVLKSTSEHKYGARLHLNSHPLHANFRPLDAKKAYGTVQEIARNVDEMMYTVGKIKYDVDEIMWIHIEQDIRKWFFSPDPTVNYNTACEAYHEGTASVVLRRYHFQGVGFDWLPPLGSRKTGLGKEHPLHFNHKTPYILAR
ncbi:hypothetical protein EDB86DRAFT_2279455 [Lactarius hatsudake]|nr:hypothetical protein EDB86DRAFT_2279455 [Lactarius hatsudake]